MYDVAIIGYGPVGATLANLIGSQGFSVAIVEREATPYGLPRAGHFDGEVMRIFQMLGLSGPLAEVATTHRGFRFVNAAGDTILEWKKSASVQSQGWATSYRFHQPDVEAILRAGVARYPLVDVFEGTNVSLIDPGRNDVTLTTHSPAGQAGSITAKYLVGADGARSIVRETMGSTVEDLGHNQRWLVVDVIMRRDVALTEMLVQYCDPARPVTMGSAHSAGRGAARRRWEFMILPEEDSATMSRPEQVWALLAPWITDLDAEIERAVVYTFHATLANGWRKGRLMVAGDAAHQMPPFLGQGLCAGMRDCANLAWKLGLVLKGADDGLLDTCETERRPHVRAFVERAIEIGGIIQTTDPDRAAKRDRDLLSGDLPPPGPPAPALGPGCFAKDDGDAHRLSMQPFLDGRLLDDQIGYRWAVLGRPEIVDEVNAETRIRWREVGAVILTDRDLATGLLEGHDRGAVLLRPDRYVFGTAATAGALDELSRGLPRPTPPDTAALGGFGASLSRLVAAGNDVFDLNDVGRQAGAIGLAPAWTGLAGRYLGAAERAERAGQRPVSGEAYRRAALAYHGARLACAPGSAEHGDFTIRMSEAHRHALRQLDPLAERVEQAQSPAPFIGILRTPADPARGAVIIVPGLDSTKEEYFPFENMLLARGLATFSIEGPGQGEMARNTTMCPEYEAVVSRAIDVIAPKIGAAVPIGLLGLSLGSLYATRSCALEPRVAALVAVGGPYRRSLWSELTDPTRAAMIANSPERTEEGGRALARRFDLTGLPERIRRPALVVFGARDALVPASHAERLAREIPGSELIMIPEGDHVCYNALPRWRPYAVDWLARHLTS